MLIVYNNKWIVLINNFLAEGLHFYGNNGDFNALIVVFSSCACVWPKQIQFGFYLVYTFKTVYICIDKDLNST